MDLRVLILELASFFGMISYACFLACILIVPPAKKNKYLSPFLRFVIVSATPAMYIILSFTSKDPVAIYSTVVVLGIATVFMVIPKLLMRMGYKLEGFELEI